jgi:hypothetical protein
MYKIFKRHSLLHAQVMVACVKSVYVMDLITYLVVVVVVVAVCARVRTCVRACVGGRGGTDWLHVANVHYHSFQNFVPSRYPIEIAITKNFNFTSWFIRILIPKSQRMQSPASLQIAEWVCLHTEP